MSTKSRRMAGILLVVFPTVVYGGFSLLNLLLHDPSYARNPRIFGVLAMLTLAFSSNDREKILIGCPERTCSFVG